MFNWIHGKKTYLISVSTILTSLYLYWQGQITIDQLLVILAGSGGLASLRHGIETTGK